MGNLLSWIYSFWEQNMEIAILGLQNAGKSSLVTIISKGEFSEDMIPTVGFNMRKFKKGQVSIKMWDLGGQSQYRSLWERYCLGMQAIVYVVDAADTDMFEDARKELHSLLSKPRLSGIPLLVLANKNDLSGAASVESVVKHLELDKLNDREVCYYSISCKNSVNIDMTLEWLIKHAAAH